VVLFCGARQKSPYAGTMSGETGSSRLGCGLVLDVDAQKQRCEYLKNE